MANDILGFMQPVLLREMLRFVMSYKTEDPQPLYRGYTIAILMFICSLSQTTVLHQYFHLCFRTGMHIRAGLVTAIYQKSLRLSNSARQEFTVSDYSTCFARLRIVNNSTPLLFDGVLTLHLLLPFVISDRSERL